MKPRLFLIHRDLMKYFKLLRNTLRTEERYVTWKCDVKLNHKIINLKSQLRRT